MFADVAAGHLIGDALITKAFQKPIECLGRITISDSIEDPGSLNIGPDIVKKRQRSR